MRKKYELTDREFMKFPQIARNMLLMSRNKYPKGKIVIREKAYRKREWKPEEKSWIIELVNM